MKKILVVNLITRYFLYDASTNSHIAQRLKVRLGFQDRTFKLNKSLDSKFPLDPVLRRPWESLTWPTQVLLGLVTPAILRAVQLHSEAYSSKTILILEFAQGNEHFSQ